MQSYKELVVWQKSMLLVTEVYKVTDQLPKHELYVLASQMIRAAISIPSNIAEGSRRNHKPEYIQFLSIALASAAELETQIIITQNQYSQIDCTATEKLLDEIQRMLYTIINKLKMS